MVTDIDVITTDEEPIHRFEPWRSDHVPRAGESVWIPEHGRRLVRHVIHAPTDGGVMTLIVSSERTTSMTPRELAEHALETQNANGGDRDV